MYCAGKTLKEIKRVTTVPGWMVKGLAMAQTLSKFG
jgi:hypothetical protein